MRATIRVGLWLVVAAVLGGPVGLVAAGASLANDVRCARRVAG